MGDEQPKARPQSDQEAASQRAVAFRQDLDRRFREAGIDQPVGETSRWVALSAPSPSDLGVLDGLQRVPLEFWKRDRKKRSDLDANAIKALKRAAARKRRAQGKAPTKAGRKPKQPKLLPLLAARDDRELELAAELARGEHTIAVDDLDLAVASLYADDQSYENVANDVYTLADELHRADIVAHGAETTVPGGSKWKPAPHEESQNTDQPSTERRAQSAPDPTDEKDEEDDATFDV